MTQRRKLEDYMKIIYRLSRNGPVHSIDIAKKLDVSKAVVSRSIDALQEEGYLKRTESRTIQLTPKGMAVAREVTDRHDGIYELLVSLGVEEKTAAQDACNIEHALSSESFCALMSLAAERVNKGETL